MSRPAAVRLRGLLDAPGPQLVVPADRCGARYVSGITEVWLGPAPDPADRP